MLLKRLKSILKRLAILTSLFKIPILILLTILVDSIKPIETYLRYIYILLNTSFIIYTKLSIIILLLVELI